jgi:hypothetical protein
MRPVVKLRCVNFFDGFSDEMCRTHILMDLCDEFTFVFTDDPHILIVGCYGQQSIPQTSAVKVGYYTENLAPDLTSFDYFFGCEYTDFLASPKYCKRVFGPLDVDAFQGCKDPELALRGKTRFCNFIYSARVPFRERFCARLSRYKQVSAPGKALNNCSDLLERGSKDWQKAKLEYLRSFKFTIAFENSRRIGYTTEKLYDALAADTVPVYWGDPLLETVVNREAVVFVDGDWERDLLPWLRLPEARIPFKPYFREPSLRNRVFGRANDAIDWLRARVPYTKGFASAIQEVMFLDNDDRAYMQKLARPRLSQQVVNLRNEYFRFWKGIIRQAAAVA